MRRIPQFGDVLQLAYVPADLDGALKYWTETVGAGPFFLRQLVFKGWRYLGEPIELNVDVAIGYWGEVQVELIRQTCRTPSVYTAWRDAGREGLHHIGIDCRDAQAARAALARAQMPIVQEVDGPNGGIFYAGEPRGPDAMLEFLCLTDSQKDYFAMLREAHRTWDGEKPVR